jgi:hypothetical protein
VKVRDVEVEARVNARAASATAETCLASQNNNIANKSDDGFVMNEMLETRKV